jgi:hypothetical protein
LKVIDAPLASVALDHVKTHLFDRVVAEVPLPLRGLNFAPDGTLSLVQWSPLGTLNCTANPWSDDDPVFLTVIVPQ